MKRSFKEFQNDNITDWSAALTYYAILAVFPGLLVLVSLLGVFGNGEETTDAMLDIVEDLGPASAVDTLRPPIENLTTAGGAAAVLSVGVIGALWSASGYLGAFSRASNAIYGVDEDRPFWKMRPQQVGMTLVIVLLLALLLLSLVITGPVAQAIGDAVGLGDTAVTIWGIAKWPVMIFVISFMFAMLYWWAPNVRQPSFRWITPGSLIAVFAWIVLSAAFGLYVANFGSYNATYGSLGGAIVFLLWLWISNNALLFGAEVNAELERQRELERDMD
jgi:membrane protein